MKIYLFLPLALVSYMTYTINQSYQCQQHTKFCFDDTYSDKNVLNDLTTNYVHLRTIVHIRLLLIYIGVVQTRRLP